MSKRRKWTMRMCAHILWLFSLMFGLSYFAIDAVGIRTAYAASQPNEHTPTDITRTGAARPASQSRLTSTVVPGNKTGHPAPQSRHLPTTVPTRAIHPTSQHKLSHPHGVRDTKSYAKPRVNHLPHNTISVTDCSTFGSGTPPVVNTLAAAMATAISGDAINFLCAADSTINVSTMNVTSTLTLNGQGNHTITLSGNDSVQVFNVSNNATLTLNHLTIAHGVVSYYGGGIRIDAGSTVNSSYDIFSSNSDQEEGGAVRNSGVFNSTNDTFIGNTSPYGGAIYNDAGTITITADAFGNGTTGNSATHNGGAIDNENGTISIPASDPPTTFNGNVSYTDGGAIYNHNSNIATPFSLLTNSVTFTNNQSTTGDGGAIYNTGAPSNISSTGDTFTGNHADNDEGGGALYNDSGSVTITGDTFGNSAHPNSATGGDGGAIYNNGIIAINNAPTTTFDSNHADVGGAIYNSSSAAPFSLSTNSVTFTKNSATNGSGGAIYNTGATSAINSTSDTFTSNTAAGGVPPINGSNGGAIYNNAGTVTSSNDTFTSNSAGNGGAVFNDSSGTYSSTNDTFTSNSAAGGVPPIGSNGGAIVNGGGTVTSTTDTFTSNSANNGGAIINYLGTLTLNGGSFGASGFPNSATVNGGAIYNAGGTITNPTNIVTFTSNTAGNGGAIYNTNALVPGPGIVPATSRTVLHAHKNMIPLPNASTITLAGGTFTSNAATTSGGAIASMGGTITLTGGTLTSNTATVSGGAIYNNGSTINSTSDTFTSNTASGNGGAIYNLGGGTFNSTTDIFTSDTATNGGAIYNTASTVTLVGGIFGKDSGTKNSASANGGAIYNAGGTLNSTVDTVKFNNNTAVNGGAIFNTTGIPSSINSLHRTRGIVPHSKRVAATGTITFAGGDFIGNSATTNGGAIYNAAGSSTTSNVSFDTNTATQDGGAIYNAGVVSSTTDTFHSNSATVNGGAIYNSTTIAPLVLRRNSGPVSSPGTVTLSGDYFGDKDKGNSATVNGGAVYNAGGTVTGTVGNTNFISNSAVSGGAIYSSGGTSNIANATFDSNSASVSGGAITNDGSFVNVYTSTFVSNTAVDGGAIYLINTVAHGTVQNSTFNNNSVTVNTTVAGGGAIEVNQGLLDLVSDTLAGNFITAQNWPGYTRGAGLYNRGGTISVLSGILAQNVVNYASNGPQQYTNNCIGPISDKGFNIESGTECEFTKNPNNTSTPDQQNVTANQLKLGALASNGGPTQTMALGNGSVAINRGANVNDNNCVSTDQRGNARVQQCDVGAFEFGAPVLKDVPGDITIDIATNPTIPGSTTSTTATWTDPTGTLPDSSDAATVTCTPAAGSVFYIGTTTVTCTAKDAANPATETSQTFKVIVKNSNNTPTLTVPDTIRVQATSSAGANVTYSVTATDGSYPDSQLTLSCKNHANSDPLPSGANTNHDFALGWTLIDCTVTNPAGKTDSKAFYVVVIDYPTVNVPKTITVPATSAQGNTVNFTVSAKDPVFAADQLTITCAPDSGSTFPIGTTTVNCRANNPDNYNNSATFNIVVQDIPTVSTPDWDNQILVVDATSKDGASVDLSKFITANNQYLQSAPAISCWLDSDTNKTNIYPPALGPAIRFRSHNGFVLPVFPITLDGNGTKVDCQATNQPGFTSSVVSFFVKVHDTLLPVLNVSDNMTVNATTPKGAVVNYSVVARDPVYTSSALTVSCWNDDDGNIMYPTGFSVSATFPIGTTQVDCRVSNPSGGYTTSNFKVTVQDKLQPTLYLPSMITVHPTSPQGATVYYSFRASDPIFPSEQLTKSCSPESGTTFAIGITIVHCNVSNPLGTTVYGTFRIRVRDAGDQIADLIRDTDALGLQHNIQSQLDGPLNSALIAFNSNRSSTGKVRDQLNNFISTVQRLRNKGLTPAQAEQLTAKARVILTVLGS